MRFRFVLGERPLPQLRDALHKMGIEHNAYALELLAELPIASPPRESVLCIRRVGELGFPDGAVMSELVTAANTQGLEVCPLEAAVLLRLAWLDQEPGRVTVASSRPHPDEGRPRGFYLRRDDEGLWLRGYVASDDWVFPADERMAWLQTETAGQTGL